MIGYAARRLLAAVPTLFAVLTLAFVIVRIVPGDPAYAILGDHATPEAVAALDAKLGLDRPILVQYGAFLARSLTGDFGRSMATGEPILRQIAAALPPTIELTLAAMVIGVVLGVPAGVWAALHRNRGIDWAARLLSLTGLSFPVFVSGIFLLLAFAVHWPLFPVIGDLQPGDTLGNLRKLVLPAATLGTVMAAYVLRVTRSAMLQTMGEDYIRTARAKGVRRRGVVWRHGLQNASLPVATVVGLYVGILIGNSALTEIVFNRPGLGSVIVNALNQRDYTMLQALMVAYCVLIVVVNLLTDIAYSWLDPRVAEA
ncbi:MAG: ABC transporter permease [Pseudomonadota bacterium]|nr:ABC transporter permease [Pseudomonadota bacterium]